MQAHRSIPGDGGQRRLISCVKVFAKSVDILGMPLLCQHLATKTLVLSLRSILRHYGNHVNVFPHGHYNPTLFHYCLWHSEDYIRELSELSMGEGWGGGVGI